MKKRALITGINGQTGSYLCELLLEKNYEVFGTVKRNSIAENQTARLSNDAWKQVRDNIVYADLLDLPSLIAAIQKSQPNEIYHLAAQSHVRISFDQPVYTTQTIALGTLNILEAVKLLKPDTKILHAATSECFGNSIDADGFQRESTPMNPVSPYGCAKVFAYNICRNYRNAYNLFISNSISFNHESERRGSNFVTAKVCKTAVQIKLGLSDRLMIGNLKAARDWSHAKDICKAIWLMLQYDKPDDFVIASGISRTVEDLCDIAFSKLGLDYTDYIHADKRYFRPEELHSLKGDATKIRETLGWTSKYTFDDIINEQLNYWMKTLSR